MEVMSHFFFPGNNESYFVCLWITLMNVDRRPVEVSHVAEIVRYVDTNRSATLCVAKRSLQDLIKIAALNDRADGRNVSRAIHDLDRFGDTFFRVVERQMVLVPPFPVHDFAHVKVWNLRRSIEHSLLPGLLHPWP